MGVSAGTGSGQWEKLPRDTLALKQGGSLGPAPGFPKAELVVSFGIRHVDIIPGPVQLFSSFMLNSVQSLSCVQPFVTPWTAAHQPSLSITNSQSLLKLTSIESVVPSNHLILCPPLLLLPSIFPRIRIFSNESVLCIRWPKYWSFTVSLSKEYSGLIAFRIDWLDLLLGSNLQ